MIRTIIINLALFAAVMGYAQNGGPVGPATPPYPPGYGVCGPITQVIYDCPTGPGYLRIAFINVDGRRVVKTPYVGSRELCLAQAAELRKTRHQIYVPRFVATCGTIQNTQTRWLVNQFGQVTSQGSLQFPSFEECLADAKALNSTP